MPVETKKYKLETGVIPTLKHNILGRGEGGGGDYLFA